MEKHQVAICAKRLRNTSPVLGAVMRRGAIRALAADSSPAAIPVLAEALSSPDEQVIETAAAALRGLTDEAAIDALCDVAIFNPDSKATSLAVGRGYRPSNEERACLYLFLTRQVDAYFAKDQDFQALRLEYERATPHVQSNILEAVRAGGGRFLGFFGVRKKLVECNESQIRLALDWSIRRNDWPRLWRAFLDLPLKLGYPLLARLWDAEWSPAEDDEAALFKQVTTYSMGLPLPRRAATTQSGVFRKWIAEGAKGGLARLPEAELVKRLETATPEEGVAIASALTRKCPPGSPSAIAVLNNPHWIVRLAGHVLGLAEVDLSNDGHVSDENYWVRELAGVEAVLDLWPAAASADDLQRLERAPREAWEGKLATVRLVLRELLRFRKSLTRPLPDLVLDGGVFVTEHEEAFAEYVS